MDLQMTTTPTEIQDCYSSEAGPRAKVCYGASLSGASLTLARASRATGSARVTAIHPSDQSEWQQFLAEAGKPGTIVAGCVSVQESLTLWLNAPFSSMSKAKKVFPSLLDIQLPFPLEQCVYQFLDVRRMPDKTIRTLAVAARREQVNALLQGYQARGIDPELLDHEGVALWTQSLREMPLAPGLTRIILYLAGDHTTAVIGKRGQFTSAHSLRHGAVRGSEHVRFDQSSPQVQPISSDSLAEHIQRFLHAEIEPGTPIQWVACGTGALDASFVDALHQRLSAEWPGPAALHKEPESFLIRALSTRALYCEPLRCNLRNGNLTHPSILRWARRQAVTGAVLLMATGLLLCGLNVAWHLMSARRFDRVKYAVTSLAADLAPDSRIQYGMEVAEVTKAVDKQTKVAAPFLDAFKPSLSVRLADIVNAGKDCQLKFETLSLRKGGVLIAGTAEDWDQCEQFTDRLQAMGYAVTLDRQEAVADTLVRFTVKGDVLTR